MGAWGWLMVAALAYGRGAGAGIAVRYFDVLDISLWTDAAALAYFVSAGSTSRGYRLAAAAWTVMFVFGVWQNNRPAVLGRSLAEWREYFVRQQTAIRGFLTTDDETWLTRDPLVRSYLPHYQLAKDLLRDPRMRPRLAPSLVPSLDVQRDDARSRGFDAEPDTASGVAGSGGGPSADEQIFVSTVLKRVEQPILRFRVRGMLRVGGWELQIEDAQGRLHDPLGGGVAGDSARWRTLNFVVPAGPVRVIAHTPAGASGFAFTAPIEIGWLSWLVPKLVSQWLWVLVAGTVCVLLGGLRRPGTSRPALSPMAVP